MEVSNEPTGNINDIITDLLAAQLSHTAHIKALRALLQAFIKVTIDDEEMRISLLQLYEDALKNEISKLRNESHLMQLLITRKIEI